MQLIGQAIRHKTFGKGIVTDWNETVLTVCFSDGDKKFIYPDAFCEYLTLKNNRMQEKIQNLLNAREVKKRAEQQAFQEAQMQKNILRTMKISPNSQAAFHVTKSRERDVLSQWSVSTGTYLSGHSKGEPRIPERMKPNTLCLLTQCADKETENERRIIGAFMVAENFFGTDCRDGVIRAHSDYRILINPENRPLFWPYFTEELAARRWGNTAFKYFSNKTAEKILFDLLSGAKSPEEQRAADECYRYFCEINRLPVRKAEDESACD